ncbi:hypothetical protein ACROYT_G004213 [Oculina patagonica]
MSDQEDIEDIFEGWLEKPTEEDAKNKGWLKKSFTKKWKKGYYVLRKYCAGDQPFLQWFDREDGWRRQMPRGTLELFPRYKVFKRMEHKTKQHIFEISTDAETLLLAAESETIMDLWVIQFQMQTILNPRVAGEVFRVKGSGSRQMQRIGARDQQCLLHISRWGLTLALERTRAVLAQWPLTTIRSYEAMDSNEFIFEGGRASPMGEGKYNFFTHNGDDNKIFDVIDNFASARLRRRQDSRSPAASSELTEDDIERAYDQLRFSLQPISVPSMNRDGHVRNINQSAPQSIDTGAMQETYNHIGRSDSIGSAHSLGSFSITSESTLSYNRLERLPSWGSQTSSSTQVREQYNRLNPVPSASSIREGSYDRLARSPSTTSRNLAQSLDAKFEVEGRCPPKQPAASQQMPGEQMTPPTPTDDFGIGGSFDELTSSNEYSQESSNLQSRPDRPSQPELTQQSTSHEEEKGRKYSRGEKAISIVGSPNFMYLNAAYSSSVEVLPALYAEVDLSKKKKNRKEAAERASDSVLTRRRSKSSDSILGTSPTFTHFAAFAADAESKSFEDSLISMIPPQKPRTERVSLALKSSVSEPSDVENRAECVTNLPALPAKKGSYSGQVEALERTLSEVSQISQNKK